MLSGDGKIADEQCLFGEILHQGHNLAFLVVTKLERLDISCGNLFFRLIKKGTRSRSMS